METKTLKEMSDEELVARAQNGDTDCLSELFTRYEGLVRSRTSAFFIAGSEHDDVIQEGRIGLLNALRKFDSSKNESFMPFAVLCIRNQIQSAIRNASRLKHRPLNQYIPLHGKGSDDEDLPDYFSGTEAEALNPESIFIDRENLRGLELIIGQTLNEQELEILNAYIDGDSYKQIADKIGKTPKAVDNALQGIKRKLKAIKPKPAEKKDAKNKDAKTKDTKTNIKLLK